IVRRIGDRRPRFFDLRHHRIHFCLASDIVAERTLSRASRAQRNFGFMGERCAGPNGELQTVLEIEEGDRAMLKLRADNSPRRQTESIPIEPQRPLQVVNTESNDRDPRLHSRTSAPLRCTRGKKLETGYFLETVLPRLNCRQFIEDWERF